MIRHSIATSPIWTAAGWTMLHLVWVGAASGLVLALLRRLLRPVRPEVRHGVAVAGLLALAASPFVLFAWVYQPDRAMQTTTAQARNRTPPDEQALAQIAPLSALKRHRPAVEPAGVAATSPVSSRFAPLVGYLPGVWLTGSLATLALLGTGLIGVEQLRRSSVLLETGAIAQCCRELAASLGVARAVGVEVCDQLVAPVLIGVLRPLILLPPAALSGWSIEQVEMALLHELAHIRRRDNLVTFLQRLAESLLFFHPVTWWLSAWISLERELCCDRLVVERTGRPRAYARMLATLAGAGPRANLPALAMAERPLTTRIRRILDMEDRSMKLTLTEGLGLIVAALVGTTLTLATQAAAPPVPVSKSVPNDVARRSLERMAGNVVTLPDGQDYYNGKGTTLVNIAQAQLKLGDRAGALTTLGLLDGLAAPSPAKSGVKLDARSWEHIAALAGSVEVRREAGDLDGARVVLGRAVRDLKILDDGVIRVAFERVNKDIETGIAKQPEGMRRLNDEEAAFILEASAILIEPCIAMGDMDLAQTLIHRVIDALGTSQGPTKAMFVGALGRYLDKAGDHDGGRDLIEQSHRSLSSVTDPQVKAFSLKYLACSMFELGEVDEALALIRELPPLTQQDTFSRMINEFTVDDRRIPWLDTTGINLKIGNPSLSPKNPAKARAILPKLAAAARTAGDARVEARTLATVALLQARSGDFAVAVATAESIPNLKRADFPGPSDGFYDAVKPATLALIAGVMAEAGDKAAAATTFDRSEALARAVEAEDQRLIAQIVIAQQQAANGRGDAAKAVIDEAVPLALVQPEPRRSRVLAMLAETQVKAGDTTAALRTVDAIRNYPGLEKARALTVLLQRAEDSGDATTSKAMAQRAIASLEAKAPETPLSGKVMTIQAFARDTFIDFDLELEQPMLKHTREAQLQSLRFRIGETEKVVRGVKALPPSQRDATLPQVIASLAQSGDVAGAMDLATSIESPDARLRAFASLAAAIPGQPTKK